MTTHYRDETVVVTTTQLLINGRTIRLSDIEHIWHDQSAPDWKIRGRTAGRGILNIAMLVCGAAGFVVLIGLAASAYLESEGKGFLDPHQHAVPARHRPGAARVRAFDLGMGA